MLDRENSLNAYEQTMIVLIKAYLTVHSNSLAKDIWNGFATLIGIDQDLLKSLIDSFDETKELSRGIGGSCYEQGLSNVLLQCLLNYYFVRKSLDEISIECSKTSLMANHELYQSIVHNINMMNVNSGNYKSMCNNVFSKKYAPQSFESFYPSDYIDMLNPYIFYDNYYKNNYRFLPVLYNIINYKMLTHSNAMILIVILQIMKHSPFLSSSIKNIATELYKTFHMLLKDARVILLQPNYLYFDATKDVESRSKSDNTTRLHIVYGYDNYDTYSLRLDLSHKGINWVHYNNKSPGGVTSFIFTKQEYQDIIATMPDMQKCFIRQNEIYFLKEKNNCNLLQNEISDFEYIEASKSHSNLFNENHNESEVLSFITLLTNFFINISYSNVDKTGVGAKYAFNLDFLMCRLDLYYLSLYLPGTETAKIQDNIIDMACNYGLIKHEEKDSFNSLEGLELIIELAKERCDNLSYLLASI